MLMHLNQRCPNILVFELGQRRSQLQCPGIEKWEGLFAMRSSMGPRTLGIVYPHRIRIFPPITGGHRSHHWVPHYQRAIALSPWNFCISPLKMLIYAITARTGHSAGPIRNAGKVACLSPPVPEPTNRWIQETSSQNCCRSVASETETKNIWRSEMRIVMLGKMPVRVATTSMPAIWTTKLQIDARILEEGRCFATSWVGRDQRADWRIMVNVFDRWKQQPGEFCKKHHALLYIDTGGGICV